MAMGQMAGLVNGVLENDSKRWENPLAPGFFDKIERVKLSQEMKMIIFLEAEC